MLTLLRRGLYILNERRVFLGLLHGFIAAYATVEHVLSARSRVQFDEDASVSYRGPMDCATRD